ncbi:MAG: dephospho-CoA kinase [Geobacteraceae bacterium]|nr:dephospho-CoA kinase [Geobacteraceae bacterium]
MKVVGLTGGIASGKSFVAGLLASWGAVIIDADILARRVVEPGKPAYQAVVRRFGDGILCPDGSLDRKALGRIVFSDGAARRELEAMVHPAVAELFSRLLAEERRRGTRVVFYVVPLLFEAGLESMMDEVWVVSVDEETELARLMARDGIGREEALRKMGAQMRLEDKVARADVVIDNSGVPEETERAVGEEWKKLLARLP